MSGFLHPKKLLFDGGNGTVLLKKGRNHQADESDWGMGRHKNHSVVLGLVKYFTDYKIDTRMSSEHTAGERPTGAVGARISHL